MHRRRRLLVSQLNPISCVVFTIWIRAVSTSEFEEDCQLMAALAGAMVEVPHASLQELAKAAGISKATLYRYCRTREQLHQRLEAHAARAVTTTITNVDLASAPALEALRRLTEKSLAHSELTAFLICYRNKMMAAGDASSRWQPALDAFFLRGQKERVFRIDLPAAALTEIYLSVLNGVATAEKQGRIARAGMAELVHSAFLEGAMAG